MNRARRRARALALLALAHGPLACRRVPTQLVVVLDSELAAPTEIDRVVITATGPSGAAVSASGRVGGSAEPAFPVTVSLVPAGGTDRGVTVTAAGFAGEREIVRDTVVSSFVRGEGRVLPMLLVRACAGVRCDPGQACVAGTCGPPPEHPGAELARFDPGAGLRADAAPDIIDASTPDAPDAGSTAPACGAARQICCAGVPSCAEAAAACVSGHCVCQGACRVADLTFEDGRLLDPVTGASFVTGDAGLESTAPIFGRYAARSADAPSTYLSQSLAPAADLFVSFYVRLTALPAAEARVAHFSNNGTGGSALLVRTSGAVVLSDVPLGRVLPESPIWLRPGAVFRLGLHQRSGAAGGALLEAFIAEGNAAFGAPFATTSMQTWPDATNLVRVGAAGSAAVDAVFDDVRIDTARMPPPSAR